MRPNSNQHQTPRLVVVGYANHDIDRYPDGRERRGIGGGGYFAALAASRELADVGFVTRVGEDFDLTTLRQRVRCDAIEVVAGGETARSIQTYRDLNNLSDRAIHLDPGVNPAISESDIPADWLRGSRVVLVSTMVPKQHRDMVEGIVRRKSGETLGLSGLSLSAPLVAVDSDLCWLQDPSSRAEVLSLMEMADIAFMNRAEGEILGDLVSRIPIVIIKKDAEGADVFVSGDRVFSVPAPRVDVVDVTGAGDVFAGTFLARVALGGTLEEAACAAVAAASLSVTKEGIDHLFLG